MIGELTPVCSHVIRLVSSEMSRFVDAYDVTLDVCLSSIDQQSQILSHLVSEILLCSISTHLIVDCVTFFFLDFSAR